MRKKKTKNHYFTSVHEDAIVKYTHTDCSKKRTELYVTLIGPALDEMVDKIIFTYKFTSLPNIGILRRECKVWLTMILDKFDPSRGHKAFSYFSVVTKNWFIHKVKSTSKKNQREIPYEEVAKDLEHTYLSEASLYEKTREQWEFWTSFIEEMNSWESMGLRPNEKRVLEGIKILMANLEDVEIFNKKAFYLYLRELTGLNTKQIVSSLSKMRDRYAVFKRKWDAGQI